MNKNIVLAVGAHPDDFVWGCGGTLLKHLDNGDMVYGLHMTGCEKDRDEKRYKEALEEAKILGLTDVLFAELPDGGLLDTPEHGKKLRKYLNELRVNIVYGPVEEDRHHDHRNCSRLVKGSLDNIEICLLYQGPRNKVFNPNYFVEITRVKLDTKIKAYTAHLSQLQKGSLFIDGIEGLAIQHGCIISHGRPYEGRRYAEAFEVEQIKMRGFRV